ncbi:iron-siderophore ABC transporter substrate-binding protein [Streptomyces sp. XM4193]|uniref:iron-siderophore ABC transporter substrate-binding protein n=1 Tax=Streptomyces sp. XM4193 TaxID=2929782 RepID=UPI001FF736C1|nr:iron-siderophore ABC transporter substrate-binding protein [Streptomyces sp. XM4193]MCK1797151.1 iron-siderophore ABC transporter substrate-binding protein [Streptomyces sp. XM4193]
MSTWFSGARRGSLLAVAAVSALLLSGCSSADDDDKGGSSGSDGSFPVSIKSALGTAKIEKQPERVVTLGQGSAETAIALGHTPVGVEEYPWGSDKSGYLPWVHEAVTEKGDELPKQFKGGEDIDMDAILELEPDVILAPWSGITQDQYDLLSDLAPTVAYPGLPWSTNWDEQIELIAKALGKPEKAEKLIGTIEGRLADAAKKRPEYEDVSFSYIYTNGPGSLGVFQEEEQRVEMVSSLGLKVDPVVNTFKETKGTDSALIGLENAEKLNKSDLVFTFYSDKKSRREVESQKLYAAIPAIERGTVVASENNAFVTASSIINPLTVPWVVDRYLPLIDKAVEKLDKSGERGGRD